ncbi:MAG: class I SAM-dependent RNA methyltransferase [Balneolales bacterium]|nr:class I SAM-dependent RNA methyltransferase [Balneolales bacterium]
MADFSFKTTLSITCPKQLSPFLSEELQQLGYRILSERQTGIDVVGSLNDSIELNLKLQTAHRILYLLAETVADTPDELYEWLARIPWEDYIPAPGYLAVTSRVNHPTINNSQFANLKTKDAIVDRIREKTGQRPNTGADTSKTVVFLFWDKQEARIFLDTSGESLSRRGYRLENTEAPMQESLAAALVKATGWKPGMHFINPMCGSGTLFTEAARRALNIDPAARRRHFGFMHIRGFDREVYKNLRKDLIKLRQSETSSIFIASDYSKAVMNAAQTNAEAAGIADIVTFKQCDFAATEVPDGDGIVILNPPYGERMGEKDFLDDTYQRIGTWFKKQCSGKKCFVFTSDLKLARKIGLKPFYQEKFYNTTLECYLLGYEIY